jgi:hypothetical protein
MLYPPLSMLAACFCRALIQRLYKTPAKLVVHYIRFLITNDKNSTMLKFFSVSDDDDDDATTSIYTLCQFRVRSRFISAIRWIVFMLYVYF